MAMTFVQMQDSILHQLGDFSGPTREKVKRWINDARNSLWEQVPGQHQEKTDYLSTTVAYESTTVITVTVTNGSTTVTSDGSSATVFTSAMVGRYVQLNGTDPWYRIASLTSVLEIELEDAYLGDSDTDCAFSVHTWTWPLATDVQRLIQVTVEDETNWSPLAIIDRVDFYNQQTLPLRWEETSAEVCFLDEDDSSGQMLLGIWPTPSSASLIRYRYQTTLPELSADGTGMGIPGADLAIKCAVLMEVFTFRNRMTEAQLWYQRYEQELRRLMSSVRRSTSTMWRLNDRTNAAQPRIIANMGSKWPR